MSSGPEHYREAEHYIDTAGQAYIEDDEITCGIKLQFAQVHATLALAAATADCISRPRRSWDEVMAE